MSEKTKYRKGFGLSFDIFYFIVAGFGTLYYVLTVFQGFISAGLASITVILFVICSTLAYCLAMRILESEQ